MRLGSCIALEALTALTLLGGGAWGASAIATELRGRGEPTTSTEVAIATRDAPVAAAEPVAVTEPVAVAATVPVAVPGTAAEPVAVAVAVTEPVAVPDPQVWAFAGTPDEPLLAPLRTGRPKRIKTNRGGTSLSLRVDFDNGARAAFKPDQIFGQSNPRREIAAYRIDRLLGIGRVPPAIPVSYPFEEVIAAVDAPMRARVRAETVPRQGVLRGELSWWIPTLADAYVNGFRIDETDGILTWRRWLKAGATIPPEHVGLCQQLSAMALFDFVIDNTDRWTGNNARVSEDRTILYFMDNTLAFGKNRLGHNKTYLYLQRSQTFSRTLVERLRNLDAAELRHVLTTDAAPFDQLLTDVEIDAVLARRDRALGYVDGLIAKHGDAKVLAFP